MKNDDTTIMTLYKTYFYQNPKTNQPSASPISAKQVCRLICPNSSTNGSLSGSRTAIIHLGTLIIEYDQLSNQYNTEQGWVPISSLPLFQYVSALWYYSVRLVGDNDDNDNRSSDNDNNVKGPVTCRELAKLFYDDKSSLSDDTTRVWSNALSSSSDDDDDKNEGNDKGRSDTSWKLLSQVPILKVAMEAFEDIVNVSFFDNDGTNKTNTASDAIKNKQNKHFQYNEEDMVYDNDIETSNKIKRDKEDDDEDILLQEFLSSTGGDHEHTDENHIDYEEEEYESDGGTKYVKFKNQWVDARMIPKNATNTNSNVKRSLQQIEQKQNDTVEQTQKKKKAKQSKPKFNAKNAKHWIYVTNLPTDTDEAEVAAYFSKVGVLDIDPDTQKPKIKLYRQKSDNGNVSMKMTLKGDASICYAKVESVELAIQLLDDTTFRTVDPKTNQQLSYELTKNQKRITVQKAKFEEKTDSAYASNNMKKKKSISQKKHQVARIAKLQAITWDEGDYNGRITGGIKGLRIIVLKHVFTIKDINDAKNLNKDKGEDILFHAIESRIRKECEEFGVVEKITIFSKNIDGVVIVKFSQPSSANDAINFYNSNKHQKNNINLIEASYWDGVTDFTVRDEIQEEAEAKKRLDDFGNWLDEQELPDEFKLNVES